MDRKDDLERLHQQAVSLKKSIDDIDLDIERATHALAAGEEPGRLISYLADQHSAQLGLMHALGKAEARIEDFDNLVREQERQPQERLAAQEWNDDVPTAEVDDLDWLKEPQTDAMPQHDDRQAAEQRMIEEAERELSPEDHLDWLRGDPR